MSELLAPRALAGIADALRARKRDFAVVGGLAVSARAQPRFTRDVDVAVTVAGDEDAEALVRELRASGYRVIATVEHETKRRLSTVRLSSPEGVTVDLLFASCGIEADIVARATAVDIAAVGSLPVARAEDLLAMKVLSMTATRLQDRIDAQHLLAFVAQLDMALVRKSLETITTRGFHRDQDLSAKLTSLLRDDRDG
jgi:hypothetical protein